MHLKCIVFVSLCLFLNASTAYRRGDSGRGYRTPSPIRASFNRPSTSSRSNTPRFAPSPRFINREHRQNSRHIPQTASAPPLSTISSRPFPNSLHTPREASAPPLSDLGGSTLKSSSRSGSRIPPPPPLPERPLFNTPSNAGSRIPKPPPLPTAPTKFGSPSISTKSAKDIPQPPPKPLSAKTISPLNSAKKPATSTKSDISSNNFESSAKSSNSMITPSVVRPIKGVPTKNNTTSVRNSQKFENTQYSNRNFSTINTNNFKERNATVLTSFPTANTPKLGNNSSGIIWNTPKPANFNRTATGSSKNSSIIGGQQFDAFGRPNATFNNVSSVSVANNTKQVQSTLAKLPPLNSQKTLNNSTGAFKENSFNVTNKQSTLSRLPPLNTQKTLNNSTGVFKENSFNATNKNFTINSNVTKINNGSLSARPNIFVNDISSPHFDNPPPKYDAGDAHRNTRNDVIGDIAKTIVKKVASKPKSAKDTNRPNNQTTIVRKTESKNFANSFALPLKISKSSIILMVAGFMWTMFMAKRC